jgi:formylglycine-generating enzyme required for sulfatase activity
LELTLAYVPEGPFLMGSETEDADRDEGPEHEVYLDAYWIGMTEVTNAQYAACEAAGVCAPPAFEGPLFRDAPEELKLSNYYQDPADADKPMIFVTWTDADTFCQWAGLTLPTEAQWEKAARGTDGRTYPWGEEISCNKANYGVCGTGFMAAGSYPEFSSPYGALNMGGNVAEWVADWYGSTYYGMSPDSNPTGPESGRSRITRGGYLDVQEVYWGYGIPNPEKYARTSDRASGNPTASSFTIGFRCAATP